MGDEGGIAAPMVIFALGWGEQHIHDMKYCSMISMMYRYWYSEAGWGNGPMCLGWNGCIMVDGFGIARTER
jgi:hypothetical protein